MIFNKDLRITARQEGEADSVTLTLQDIESLKADLLPQFGFIEEAETDEPLEEISQAGGPLRADCRLYTEMPLWAQDPLKLLQRVVRTLE